MKVTSLVIKNAKSFKESTEIEFKNGMNILIGPNGGGKTNVLDILSVLLRNIFFIGYQLVPSQVNDQVYYRAEALGSTHQIETFNYSVDYDQQNFEITFEISDEDISNINILSKTQNLNKYFYTPANDNPFVKFQKNINDVDVFVPSKKVSHII